MLWRSAWHAGHAKNSARIVPSMPSGETTPLPKRCRTWYEAHVRVTAQRGGGICEQTARAILRHRARGLIEAAGEPDPTDPDP